MQTNVPENTDADRRVEPVQLELDGDNGGREMTEALLTGENKILEMVAVGKPLTLILEEVCHLVESLCLESKACVLLLDSTDCLRAGSTGSRFPKDFLTFVDGIKIGSTVGSCGSAAYLKKLVIVEDIATSPLWKNYGG